MPPLYSIDTTRPRLPLEIPIALQKDGPTQIRTGVPRTRISYAAPTPWDPSLYSVLFPSDSPSVSLLYLLLFLSPCRLPVYPVFMLLYPPFICFYMSAFLILLRLLYKKTPPVGLEPTTLRLKAARSTD